MKERKLNNKGFSLVELIIVIAIMVILVVVIAPQYLKFVNNARISTDIQTADTVQAAIYAEITQGSSVFPPDGNFDGSVAGDVTAFTTNVTTVNAFPESRFNGYHFVITGDNATGVTAIDITNGTNTYRCWPNSEVDASPAGINRLRTEGSNPGLRQ